MEDALLAVVRGVSGALFGWLDLSEARSLVLFVHLAAVLLWAGPAMGASWFVYAAAWERRRDEGDAELARRELWVRRQFNRVVALEHLAFAALIVSGLMLGESVDWAYAGQAWLTWKLALVLLIFIPMELLDVVLSAWFQKVMTADAEPGGDGASPVSRAARSQDLFLRATIPPVMLGIPIALYLAVVKPL